MRSVHVSGVGGSGKWAVEGESESESENESEGGGFDGINGIDISAGLRCWSWKIVELSDEEWQTEASESGARQEVECMVGSFCTSNQNFPLSNDPSVTRCGGRLPALSPFSG